MVALIISVFFRDQHICFAKAKQQGRSQNRVRAQSSLRELRFRAHLQGRDVIFSFVTKLPRIFPFSPKIISTEEAFSLFQESQSTPMPMEKE